jgi:hypothetical protein
MTQETSRDEPEERAEKGGLAIINASASLEERSLGGKGRVPGINE